MNLIQRAIRKQEQKLSDELIKTSISGWDELKARAEFQRTDRKRGPYKQKHEYKSAYYAKNRDKHLATMKSYYRENLVSCRETMKLCQARKRYGEMAKAHQVLVKLNKLLKERNLQEASNGSESQGL